MRLILTKVFPKATVPFPQIIALVKLLFPKYLTTQLTITKMQQSRHTKIIVT